MIPFFNLKTQYNEIKDEINRSINRVLSGGNFILGEEVASFEEKFAKFCKVKFTIAVGSGSSALFLALKSIGIKEGDEVITVPNTFIATAYTISHTGAKPVFVDVEEDTFNIDTTKIEDRITDKTKAILPVHLYGYPADMDPILEIAEKHNLKIVEDAAQAIGSEYKGKKIGSFGDVTAFSFYPTKNLGAYGDGGMIVTKDSKIAEKIKLLRNYGQKLKYHHILIGFNSRLDEIQAAILKIKLKKLNKWIDLRRKNAKLYNKLLKNTHVITPIERQDSKHVYYLYVVRSSKRDKLQEWLKSQKIETMIHYPIPIHLQNAYKDLGYKRGDFPITEKCANEILSLPMFPELKSEQIRKIADCIRNFKN